MKTKIAIDFDGVICERIGIPTMRDWRLAKPMEGALSSILLLKELGYEIWVFTSNPEIDKVQAWLNENKFPNLEVTNVKKPAHVYIDDRALRFTNWQDIRKYFS